MRRSVRLWESRRRFEEKRGLSRSARTSTSSVPHSAAVATLFGNQLPPLGRGEAMAKNEQSIQNSVRIQSTAVLAGSSSNWGRGIDRRAPVSSRSCGEFAGVRIEFGPPGSSSLARRSATCSAGQAATQPQVPTREQQVGWAIVGLGQLTLEEILPAFGACKCSYPAALVSRAPREGRPGCRHLRRRCRGHLRV
jgi:hypothetical protein